MTLPSYPGLKREQLLTFIVLRDIEERGRELEHILHQYTTLVKPAFEEFCFPVSLPIFVCFLFLILCWQLLICDCVHTYELSLQTKKFADVIIPRGADNSGMYVFHLNLLPSSS